jgi:hypothetical protein
MLLQSLYSVISGHLTCITFSVLFTQMACLALAFDWPKMKKRPVCLHLPGSTRSFVCALLALLSVSSPLVTLYRWPTSPPQPYHPGPRILTAGIWTVHFGMDNEGRDSQRRIRDLVRDMHMDVVGLLETDLHVSEPVDGWYFIRSGH